MHSPASSTSENKSRAAQRLGTIWLSTGITRRNVLTYLYASFFTIGVVSNFRKLWDEGIGRLAAVYVICLFGFIIWVGLLISWIFFHGVTPPLVTG